MKKRTLVAVLATLLICTLVIATGCGGQQQKETAADKPLRVGATAGPHAEIMDKVKAVAAKDGLKIEVVEFNDYVQPNVALNDGDLDANSYQHQPYLDHMVSDRKYQIVSVAKTIVLPMGAYSNKVKNINDLPTGAVVSIPNDPTNGGRALLLLEKAGLIKLNPNAGLKAPVADIVDYPKKFKIKELDAAQVPRSLDDVDLAVINSNYALAAGMNPLKQALVIEDADSPYVNVLAVHKKNVDDPRIKQLIKAYHSDEVKQFINERFQGAVVAAW